MRIDYTQVADEAHSDMEDEIVGDVKAAATKVATLVGTTLDRQARSIIETGLVVLKSDLIQGDLVFLVSPRLYECIQDKLDS